MLPRSCRPRRSVAQEHWTGHCTTEPRSAQPNEAPTPCLGIRRADVRDAVDAGHANVRVGFCPGGPRRHIRDGGLVPGWGSTAVHVSLPGRRLPTRHEGIPLVRMVSAGPAFAGRRTERARPPEHVVSDGLYPLNLGAREGRHARTTTTRILADAQPGGCSPRYHLGHDHLRRAPSKRLATPRTEPGRRTRRLRQSATHRQTLHQVPARHAVQGVPAEPQHQRRAQLLVSTLPPRSEPTAEKIAEKRLARKLPSPRVVGVARRRRQPRSTPTPGVAPHQSSPC
jgi:hypothetical protein